MFKKVLSVFLLLISTVGYAQTGTTTTSEPPAIVITDVQPASATSPAVSNSGYDKGFFIQSSDEKFRLGVTGFVQGYFEFRSIENGTDEDDFRVRRARLRFFGHTFTKKIQYELEYDFSSRTLLSTNIQLVRSDALKFRVGQFHVPFSLEQMASSSAMQLVDRSNVYAYFGLPEQRETGAGFNGVLLDKKLEYAVGVFNGEGINELNINNEFRYAGRLVFNVAGNYGTDFSDLGISEDLQLAVAVGGMFNDTPDPATIVAPALFGSDEKKVYSVTPEIDAKYMGLGFHGSYYYQRTNQDIVAAYTDHGYLAQVGYMVTPMVEVAARFGFVERENLNDLTEYTGGVNYYIHKDHRAKLQLDYSALQEDNAFGPDNDRWDQRVRAQLQVRL